MASIMPEKTDQKSLKCGICLENLRNRRDLSCLHSFCVECLDGWVKKSDTEGMLSCPTCMKETPIPKEGVQGFPVHEKSSQDEGKVSYVIRPSFLRRGRAITLLHSP